MAKKRIYKVVKLLLAFPFVFPIIVSSLLISPFLRIRFGRFVNCSRIGHIVADSALMKIDIDNCNKKTIAFFFLDSKVCNLFWEKVLYRNFLIHSSVYYLFFWASKLPFCNSLIIEPAMVKCGSRDIGGDIYRAKGNIFDFSEEENKLGHQWLNKKFGKENLKFVCLLIRDDAYLKNHRNHLSTDAEIYKHSYRDTEISTYTDAINCIIKKDIAVIRMGQIANKKMNISHPLFLDYPFDRSANDFLDIWLMANCSLTISSSSGLDIVSEIYKVPTIFINAVPLSLLYSYRKMLWSSKILLWKNNRKNLSLEEAFKYGYLSTFDYDKMGILNKDLTSKEITRVVKEGLKIFIDKDPFVEEILRKKTADFFRVAKKLEGFSKEHCFINPDAYIDSNMHKIYCEH